MNKYLLKLTVVRLFVTAAITSSIWFTIWFCYWVQRNMGADYATAYVWVSSICSAGALFAFINAFSGGKFDPPKPKVPPVPPKPYVPLEYVSHRKIGSDTFVTLKQGDEKFVVSGHINNFTRTDGVPMTPAEQAEADAFGYNSWRTSRE